MPPKKKLKETRSNTDIFLLGQPSPTPATMTKPLTNGDLVRYLHHRKYLEDNKSTSWENLFCCPLISGATEASCHTKGCKFKGGDDLLGRAENVQVGFGSLTRVFCHCMRSGKPKNTNTISER